MKCTARTVVLFLAGFLACIGPAAAKPSPRPPAGSSGPAIPIRTGETPTLVTKLRVTDCRAVRGFVGAPVDGSLNSASWDGKTWEYPMPGAGAAVGYSYLNADGLHITLADDQGFNAVVVRGGIKATLLRDVQKYDDPASGKIVHEFPGRASTSRAWFDAPVKTQHVSFFHVSDGLIADCSFFRVGPGPGELSGIQPAISEHNVTGQPISLVSQPLQEETAIAALGVDFLLQAPGHGPTNFTISIADPLNPRLELHGADYVVTGSGRVHVICDFPDQILPAGTKLAVKLSFDRPANVGTVKLEQYRIPTQQAVPEALEYRKFILHALYVPICEARPWNVWNKAGDDEKYLHAPPDTGDKLQDHLRPFVREIVKTLNQCRALDPEGKDPIVRQYYQWMYRKILSKSPKGMPRFKTSFDHVDGVPEWATLVHQAWMQARAVPQWWLAHRLTPDGELGGEVGDDTDMFGNYAPFPMFERGPADSNNVGAMVLDAAARLAETAEKDTLELGVNKRSMDPLHAYEEGMNLEAEMAYWNYGDPIYLERCMAAARSTEPMTVLTDKGHRHFRNNDLGVKDVRKPGPLEGEHGTHALMWHPTLVLAWYNHNPTALKWLTEWGDGWLAHMNDASEEYGISVKLPEDITSKTDNVPFSGGWGMTGSIFTFLADLTGDARFVRPYTDYFAATGKDTGIHFAELLQMGMLPDPQKTAEATQGIPWNAVLYTTGDKAPFIAALRKDIEELQRFPYMYTAVECYTDRVFLDPSFNPTIAYTGGYTTRNKLNLTYAVSWKGLGTDYAALVTAATGQRLKLLLCNLSDKPLNGTATLWRLEPGEYELTFGPDANNDDQLDQPTRTETLAISKGSEIALTLPPKVVQVLELKQKSRGEPIYDRPDLALAARELKLSNGRLSGIAHNIGSREVKDVVVALVDEQGKTVQTRHLGALAAPLDLKPRTIPFTFDSVPADARGWSVVLDPEGAVPEIYEGNNRAPLPR